MLEQKYINGQTAVNIARSIEGAVSGGKISPGEQLPAMPDRGHPESGQIVCGELRQDRDVDIASAKRELVLPQAQTF